MSPALAADSGSIPRDYQGKIIRRRLRRFPDRLLALTFDDGPDPKTTPRILKALKAHHARATFFVVGEQGKLHPDILRRIALEGHAVESHSYSHPKNPSPAEAVEELSRTEKIIQEAAGRLPTCFRPPYGKTHNAFAAAAARKGYALVLWTISSADSSHIEPGVIAHNVIFTPNPGDIVLMHDGPGHRASAAAVEAILPRLRAEGFRFVTVPELMQSWNRWTAARKMKRRLEIASSRR
ncbi:MAG: polysaccharide deacetylase family protein [Armatimonadetes bacterium]|nr:polysaccharide deacetylase family protein [Armatimonadota bacterium]